MENHGKQSVQKQLITEAARRNTNQYRKPQHYLPGAIVLRNNHKGTGLVICKPTFQKFIRDTSKEFGNGIRFQSHAMLALQEAIETYVIDLFKDASLSAAHGGRVTVTTKNIQLARRMRGERAHKESSP